MLSESLLAAGRGARFVTRKGRRMHANTAQGRHFGQRTTATHGSPAKLRWKSTAWCAVGLVLLAECPAEAVQAGWLSTVEQEARTHFERGDYDIAADVFEDAYRRGVALYRAGRYQEAARAFSAVDRAEVSLHATYNLGNARFQQGEYLAAVEAYERVLERDPGHEDARHNLQLARLRIESLREVPREEPESSEQPEQDSQRQDSQVPRQQEAEQQESQTQSGDDDSQQHSGESEQQSGEGSGGEGSEQQTGETGQPSDEASGSASNGRAGGPSTDEDTGDKTSKSEEQVGDEPGERLGEQLGEASDAAGGDEASSGIEQEGRQATEDQGWGSLFGQFPDPWSEDTDEAEKAPGADKERPDADAGDSESEPEQLAGLRAPLDRHGTPQDQPQDSPASHAVDEVDQSQQAGDTSSDRHYPGAPGFPGALGDWRRAAIPLEWLMEQWLEQVDRGPSRLLRNQFLVEEQRAAALQGGSFVEPRPW